MIILPLTKEQWEIIFETLNYLAKEESAYEYGLPTYDEKWKAYAREILNEKLATTEENE